MSESQPSISASLWAKGLKRASDFLLALLMIVLTAPVWLAAMLLIKITAPGPLFFFQDRVGKDGKIFQPYKFRTMAAGRRVDPKELVPLDHPEITLVGRWLRRLKIDELPQLVNVLTGEMSIIGPRPTLPDQVEAYDDFRRQRLLVRPGITGLAQVHGNTGISWDQRILYDIAYVRRCSLPLDILVAAKTIYVIARGEDAGIKRFQESPFARFVDVPDGYEQD